MEYLWIKWDKNYNPTGKIKTFYFINLLDLGGNALICMLRVIG